ncbi:VOC family protein [Sphingobium sp. AN558]|uniref:VOC family protein n=1 Tax=Sphingobium sp. AN558 TaxID=3133442 RepID=UPI0030BC028A
MTDVTGKFFWYELMTSDPQAAIAFYSDVVGWTAQSFGDDPGADPYHVLTGSGGQMGGVMAIPAEAKQCGMTPWWGGYVGSADVDADVARLTAAGARVKRAAEDIPGVGRFAVMSDPGGAIFMLLKGSSPEGFEAPPAMATGHVGWHELASGDYDADLTFYTGQFGWVTGDGMDMGPMGTYQLWSQDRVARFDAMTGAIMPKVPQQPAPGWLFYFNVGDIDAAHERITAGGGSVTNGPMEVPGGAWIVQAIDPQGAAFAVVGMRAQQGSKA